MMVSVIASNTVDRGFKPKIKQLVFDASQLSAQHCGERGKTRLLGMRTMCLSGQTYLNTDSYVSEWRDVSKH